MYCNGNESIKPYSMSTILKLETYLTKKIANLYNRLGGDNFVKGVSLLRRFYNFEIHGHGNIIDIRGKLSPKVRIVIYGNNHRLTIEENVVFSKGTIWFEDNGCEIFIGAQTTIGEAALSAAEDDRKIIIGTDCMFSKGIKICTTDSHSIINLETGERTNQAKDVTIGSHVWLGQNVAINKGVEIGQNSIVAGHSVLTKSIPSNCIAAGVPARVVKSRVDWLRKRI